MEPCSGGGGGAHDLSSDIWFHGYIYISCLLNHRLTLLTVNRVGRERGEEGEEHRLHIILEIFTRWNEAGGSRSTSG